MMIHCSDSMGPVHGAASTASGVNQASIGSKTNSLTAAPDVPTASKCSGHGNRGDERVGVVGNGEAVGALSKSAARRGRAAQLMKRYSAARYEKNKRVGQPPQLRQSHRTHIGEREHGKWGASCATEGGALHCEGTT